MPQSRKAPFKMTRGAKKTLKRTQKATAKAKAAREAAKKIPKPPRVKTKKAPRPKVKGPAKTKKLRISTLAQCIRKTAATAPIPRKFMPDASTYDPTIFMPTMSGKFTALIDKIKQLDAADMRDHGTLYKHFIFTDIRESAYGAKALAAFMIAAGFELRMKVVEKQRKVKGKMVKTKHGETVYVQKEPVEHGSNGFAVLQSFPMWKNGLSTITKKNILKAFNSRPDNIHGELLRIAILDSKFKEGIDLFDVKYVHLMEPAIATSDLKQAVGRATRFCGQKGLAFAPRRGWPLEVFVYTADLPGRPPFAPANTEQKIDAHELMLRVSGLDLALLNLVKELTVLGISSAVDYDLNYKINNFDIEAALLEAAAVDDIIIAEVAHRQAGGAKLVAVHEPEDITPALMNKCAHGRKSKLFPFTNKRLARVAARMGLPVGKSAKRAKYCELLKSHPTYLDEMLKPDSVLGTPSTLSIRSSPARSEVTEEVLEIPENTFPAPQVPKKRSTIPSVHDLYERAEDRHEAYEIIQSLKKLPVDEFQRAIVQMYSKHRWASPVVKNGCEAVAAGVAGKPVSFTQTQDFVRHYLTPDSPFKGLLAWHSVGTGKTCMAVAAASTYFEKAGYTILWVTRNALMADVYKNIFGSVCSIPIMEKLESGASLPKTLGGQKRMLNRVWMEPISYRTFQNALNKKNELGRLLHAKHSSDPLHRTFLIIDEIHKLQDGDLSASEAADFKTIQRFIHESYTKSGRESVRPLLMTATPITDKPNELFEILNTLIPTEEDRFMPFDSYRQLYTTEGGEITEAGKSYFKSHAKGLISYLNREFDPTTFAQPVFHTIRTPVGEANVPEMQQLVQKCAATLEIPEIEIDEPEPEQEVEEVQQECEALDRELETTLAELETADMSKKDKVVAIRNAKKTHKLNKKACTAALKMAEKARKAAAKTRKAGAKAAEKAHKAAVKEVLAEAVSCFKQEKAAFTRSRKMEQMKAIEKCYTEKTPKVPKGTRKTKKAPAAAKKAPAYHTQSEFKKAVEAYLINPPPTQASIGAVINNND
jgi:hypothetical protein